MIVTYDRQNMVIIQATSEPVLNFLLQAFVDFIFFTLFHGFTQFRATVLQPANLNKSAASFCTMDPKYVLQLLHKQLITQQLPKPKNKISTDLRSLRFQKLFDNKKCTDENII